MKTRGIADGFWNTQYTCMLLGVMFLACIASSSGVQEYDIEQFFEPTGYMGDLEDPNFAEDMGFSMSSIYRENAKDGPFCIKVTYPNFGPKGWGGIYWQNKPDNEGLLPGEDLSEGGYKFVTFWAKGERGGEIVEFKAGGIDVPELPNKDKFRVTVGRICLSREWKEYYIDLRGKDLSSVIGGFCWSANQRGNPKGKGLTFYIDRIRYTSNLGPSLSYYDIGSRFYPTGWMGDAEDSTSNCIGYSEVCQTDCPKKPSDSQAKSCMVMKVSYTTQGATKRWAGIYWQNIEDNWGKKPGENFADSGYNYVSFWIRGKKGNEVIRFGSGGINSGEKFKDLYDIAFGQIILTQEWKYHKIALPTENKKLSCVIGGFWWSANLSNNPGGAVFDLYDIRFERDE